MSKTISQTDLLEAVTSVLKPGEQKLVAIAGPPAGGKSLLAAWLINEFKKVDAVGKIIPMDGFHLDNRLLEKNGRLARKGAPDTFDALGFITMVERIKRGDKVVYPVFDRQLDIAIAGADEVDASCDFLIFEGNYLLFDRDPWRQLSQLWDLTIWLETPVDVTRSRCIQRWLDYNHSYEEAEHRAESNDVRNARLINENRLPADITLYDGEW